MPTLTKTYRVCIRNPQGAELYIAKPNMNLSPCPGTEIPVHAHDALAFWYVDPRDAAAPMTALADAGVFNYSDIVLQVWNGPEARWCDTNVRIPAPTTPPESKR